MREYTTKPVTVLATEILEGSKLTEIKTGVWKYEKREGCIISVIDFNVKSDKEEPKVGDFIVSTKEGNLLKDAEDFKAKYSKKGSMII